MAHIDSGTCSRLAGHSRLHCGDQNIDIWLCYYNEIADVQLLSNLRELLTSEELHEQTRFHFADDRKCYLVTRAMVRTVLSRYASIAAGDWTFANNEYGRPEITNGHHEAAGLCFNITHARGLIALAISRHRALGIDVENLVERPASVIIAEQLFSPVEAAELAAAPQELRHHRFFEYWTFKESYIKARGMGLSLPLDQFSFHFPHERAVRIAIDPQLGDDANRWSFWQFQPAPAYLLALCAQRTGGDAPTITVRRTIPTVFDETVEPAWLKTSGASPKN